MSKIFFANRGCFIQKIHSSCGQVNFLNMEDVPLQDFNQTPTVASTEDEEAQLQRYKTRIGTTIELMRIYFTCNDWQLIDSTTATSVALYEKHLLNEENLLLKAKAIVQGRSSRYFHVIRDHEELTRLHWDQDNIASCKEHETYKADEGDIVVVESVWRTRHPAIFSDRRVFGILTSMYNAELGTYSLYFCSEEHLRFGKQKDKSVLATAMMGIVLRRIDKEQTEITMVLRVDPKVATFAPMSFMFLAQYKEELRKRVLLYEQVVAKWDTFYGPSKDPKKVENRK